jgi:hypothetical protein
MRLGIAPGGRRLGHGFAGSLGLAMFVLQFPVQHQQVPGFFEVGIQIECQFETRPGLIEQLHRLTPLCQGDVGRPFTLGGRPLLHDFERLAQIPARRPNQCSGYHHLTMRGLDQVVFTAGEDFAPQNRAIPQQQNLGTGGRRSFRRVFPPAEIGRQQGQTEPNQPP